MQRAVDDWRVEAASGSDAAWDGVVEKADHATFCHWRDWSSLVEEVLGAEVHSLVARDGAGDVRALLPLFRVRSRLFGDFLVSVPFLSYGGPVGPARAQTRLVEEAFALGRRLAVDAVELRTRHVVAATVQPTVRRLTVVLPLPESADILWRETFRSKLRSQIRRPLKEGMAARFSADEWPAFYEIYSRNMRSLGTPALPARWFRRIAETFGDRVVFGSVYAGARPVAAGCGFLWRGEFEMTWASSLREWDPHAPNMLLYWSFLEHVIGRGARVFNFGRCREGSGTHRFKLQWGGSDVPLPWLLSASVAEAAPPGANEGRYQLASAVWRRLPLSLTRRLGPALARKLP